MVVAVALWTGIDRAVAGDGPGSLGMFAVDELASRLIAAYDAARTVAPITDEAADFDVAAAYDVLFEIERRRRAQGWVPGGTQDRIHQPHDMAALRRVRPDLGAHVDAHRAPCASMDRRRWRSQASCNRASNPKSCSGCAARCPITDDARGNPAPRRVDRRGFRDRAKPFPGLEVQGAGLHRGVRAARRAGCRHAGARRPPPIAPHLRRCSRRLP